MGECITHGPSKTSSSLSASSSLLSTVSLLGETSRFWPLLPSTWQRENTCILAGGGVQTLCCWRPHHCSPQVHCLATLGSFGRCCRGLAMGGLAELLCDSGRACGNFSSSTLVDLSGSWCYRRTCGKDLTTAVTISRMSTVVRERVFFHFAWVVPLLFVFCLWHLGSSYKGWLCSTPKLFNALADFLSWILLILDLRRKQSSPYSPLLRWFPGHGTTTLTNML